MAALDLARLPSCFSLKYDLFPALVKAKPCFGFIAAGLFVDIATPERYCKANSDYPNSVAGSIISGLGQD
jgi:NDP-sugar pyrophosphorylase family protein